MTMPGRIRVWKTSDSIGSSHGWNESYGETPYIRADIAEELAQAASVALANYFEDSVEYISGMIDLQKALTAFCEASK